MLKDKIIELAQSKNKALNEEEYLREFKDEKKEDILNALDELVNTGIFRRSNAGRFVMEEAKNRATGTMTITRNGYGFLLCDDRNLQDVYIAQEDLKGSMNGDRVLVDYQEQHDGRLRGKVIGLIERAKVRIIGTLEMSEGFAFLIPYGKSNVPDLYIDRDNLGGATDEDVVEVEIIKGPKKGKSAEAKVIDILGKKKKIGIEKEIVLRELEIPTQFAVGVIDEVSNLEEGISEEERKKRLVLNDRLVVTIDGLDAKDLDDAISVQKIEGGYRLGVHIADVSHYVKENGEIDKEALKRGTSVYLIDEVIPMLPEALSNDRCSLNPEEEKLTLSVFMDIDKQAKVFNHKIVETITYSDYRLNYTEVSDYLEKGEVGRLGEITEFLEDARDLAMILKKKRTNNGSIEFDLEESEIIVDEKGWPIDIRKRERRIGDKIIEEFMIKANEVVAEQYYWTETPFLYRTHEKPSQEKLEIFQTFIKPFGYAIKGSLEDISPKALEQIVEAVKGSKEETLINRMMLRSLKQAKYTNYLEGHFGLASKYYSHFTSPIRRYPDLQIHRIIKEDLNGKLSNSRRKHYENILESVAQKSSVTERRAEDAERRIDNIKMAQYMSEKIGQVFDSVVSGVMGFGIFVALENGVEGMIAIDSIEEPFVYDEENMRLVSLTGNRTISIGDMMRVQLVNVNIPKGQIDFIIEEKHGKTTN